MLEPNIRLRKEHSMSEKRVFFLADAVLELPRRQTCLSINSPFPKEAVRGTAACIATWHIHIASHENHRHYANSGLSTRILLIESKAPCYRCRLCRRVATGEIINVACIDSANIRSLFGSHSSNSLFKLLKPIHPLLHDFFVVESLLDNDIARSHGKSSVRTRTYLQYLLSARAKPSNARVNHDKFATALHHVDDGMAKKPIRIRWKRVFAPAYQELGKNIIWVVIALWRPSSNINLGIADVAKNTSRGHVSRPVTSLATHAIHVIRSAEHC